MNIIKLNIVTNIRLKNVLYGWSKERTPIFPATSPERPNTRRYPACHVERFFKGARTLIAHIITGEINTSLSDVARIKIANPAQWNGFKPAVTPPFTIDIR